MVFSSIFIWPITTDKINKQTKTKKQTIFEFHKQNVNVDNFEIAHEACSKALGAVHLKNGFDMLTFCYIHLTSCSKSLTLSDIAFLILFQNDFSSVSCNV